MRKLYEIFKVLKVQLRIVSDETIRGNMVILYPALGNFTTHIAIPYVVGTKFSTDYITVECRYQA